MLGSVSSECVCVCVRACTSARTLGQVGECHRVPTLCFAGCQIPVLMGTRQPGCGPSLNCAHPLTTCPIVNLDADGDGTELGEMCKVRAGLAPS